MKKLTAGIFTVLIGLCAANSADATVASSAWVNEKVGANTNLINTLTTTVSDNKTAAENALSSAKSELEGKITAEATARENADNAIHAKIGTLPEDSADVIAYINKKTEGIATDAALGELQGQVTTNATNIGLNTAAIATLNGSGEGSVAKSISDALTSYTNTEDMTEAIKEVSDALDAYETSNDQEIADLKLADTAINTKIGTVAEGKDVVTMISDGDTATLTAAKAYAKEQADAASGSASGVASDLEAYKTTVASTYATQDALGTTNTNVTNLTTRVSTNETDIAGLQSAINNEETGLLKKVADNAAAAKDAADAAAANLETLTTQAGLISANATNIQKNSDAIAAEVQRATAAEQANAAAAKNADDKAVAAQEAADAAQETANAAIPKPTGACANAENKCVLTYNNSVYTWEVIERATGETGF